MIYVYAVPTHDPSEQNENFREKSICLPPSICYAYFIKESNAWKMKYGLLFSFCLMKTKFEKDVVEWFEDNHWKAHMRIKKKEKQNMWGQKCIIDVLSNMSEWCYSMFYQWETRMHEYRNAKRKRDEPNKSVLQKEREPISVVWDERDENGYESSRKMHETTYEKEKTHYIYLMRSKKNT